MAIAEIDRGVGSGFGGACTGPDHGSRIWRRLDGIDNLAKQLFPVDWQAGAANTDDNVPRLSIDERKSCAKTVAAALDVLPDQECTVIR